MLLNDSILTTDPMFITLPIGGSFQISPYYLMHDASRIVRRALVASNPIVGRHLTVFRARLGATDEFKRTSRSQGMMNDI